MVDQATIRFGLLLVVAAAFISSHLMVSVSARYLPTRSQDDRLDKLRELLKDLLESDYDKRAPMIDYGETLMGGSRPGVYKRSAGLYSSSPSDKMVSFQGMDKKASSIDGFPALLFPEIQQSRKSMK